MAEIIRRAIDAYLAWDDKTYEECATALHPPSRPHSPLQEIARIVGIARNTVRRYLRGKQEAIPRPKRVSKLDPYKAQIRQWLAEDHLSNCETMVVRLQEQGYTGSLSLLKAYVHPLRPRKAGQQPVQRYETKPGEQMQFDWGEFLGIKSKVELQKRVLLHAGEELDSPP